MAGFTDSYTGELKDFRSSVRSGYPVPRVRVWYRPSTYRSCRVGISARFCRQQSILIPHSVYSSSIVVKSCYTRIVHITMNNIRGINDSDGLHRACFKINIGRFFASVIEIFVKATILTTCCEYFLFVNPRSSCCVCATTKLTALQRVYKNKLRMSICICIQRLFLSSEALLLLYIFLPPD